MSDQTPPPFRPYEGFEGRVDTTMAESRPSWPERPGARPGSPNVIVMLADDLGFSDVGCFGSEIPTPHLDRTAAEGVRHANFRVTPLCSPTRASLMSGLNAHAAGVGFPTQIDPGFPGYSSELPLNQPVMPEVFRANGYATLMVGKWHLCREEDFTEAGSRHNWPLQRGFDQFYGFLEALTNFHHPHRIYEGNSVVQVEEYPDDYYLTDDLTDRAERMIREVRSADPDKPFFLYYSHGAVHAPMHAKADDVARHRGRYDGGWDEVRRRRLQRQVESGLMPEDTELPPRNSEAAHGVEPWAALSAEEQRIHARHMEVYAAMVESIDQSLGRLRSLLTEMGELDNTVILFCSDNGAARLTDLDRPLPSWATTSDTGTATYFGYMQDPGVPVVDERLPDNLDALGGPTTWPHYPRGWAMASNTPFRLYKFSTLRGGQQSPLIFSWPRGLRAEPDAVRRQYAHVNDVLPTLVDLLDLTVPTERDGKEAAAWAGTSFARVLEDSDAVSTHREQYTECVGNRAFYRDGWEAVTHRRPLTPFSQERWQLYHDSDPAQRNDLAAVESQRLAELQEGFDAAAWDHQVYPLDEGSGLKFLQKPPMDPPRPRRILTGTPTLERHLSSLLIQGDQWSAEIEWAYQSGDEGVVLAHGDQGGGYLLFVEDDGLYLEQNEFGHPRRFGPVPLPDTSAALELTMRVVDGRWDATVRVDGVERLAAPGLVRFVSFLPFEGIDVGVCRRSPVSWDLYRRRGTFRFTGLITAVTYVRDTRTPEQLTDRVNRARELGLGLQ